MKIQKKYIYVADINICTSFEKVVVFQTTCEEIGGVLPTCDKLKEKILLVKFSDTYFVGLREYSKFCRKYALCKTFIKPDEIELLVFAVKTWPDFVGDCYVNNFQHLYEEEFWDEDVSLKDLNRFALNKNADREF